MMMPGLVSVIVPNYNHAPFLKTRIDSILNQSYQNIELIILDDASDDGSQTIIEQYRGHPMISHIEYNRINSGSTFTQWVKGFEQARGEYIWMAESDDSCDPRFLDTLLPFLVQENCSLCFSQSLMIDANGQSLGLYDSEFPLYDENFLRDGNELIRDYLSIRNIIPNASAVVFKSDCLNPVINKEITAYRINGDWYLWIHILLNRSCAFVREPLNYFRRHEGAGSHANIQNFKNIEESFRINRILKENKIELNKEYWINAWASQANYNIIRLLRKNFMGIYKKSFVFTHFPLIYMFYLIAKKGISKLSGWKTQ